MKPVTLQDLLLLIAGAEEDARIEGVDFIAALRNRVLEEIAGA